jgi:hypothetical protein
MRNTLAAGAHTGAELAPPSAGEEMASRPAPFEITACPSPPRITIDPSSSCYWQSFGASDNLSLGTCARDVLTTRNRRQALDNGRSTPHLYDSELSLFVHRLAVHFYAQLHTLSGRSTLMASFYIPIRQWP